MLAANKGDEREIRLLVDPGAIFKYPSSEKLITISQFHMVQKLISTVPICNQFIFGPSLNAITLRGIGEPKTKQNRMFVAILRHKNSQY